MITPITATGNQSRGNAFLESRFPFFLCLLAGFLGAFTVPIVGKLPVAELILILVFPWFVVHAIACRGWPTRFQQLGWYRMLMILTGVMAVGYIISDVYRGTAGGNIARGWARVAFLSIDLATIAYLIDGSWARLQVFALALYVGFLVNACVYEPLYNRWWEFGIGPTLIAVSLFLCGGFPIAIQVALALSLGVLSLGLGARSLGGISFLTGALLGIRRAHGFLRPFAYLAVVGAIVALLFGASKAMDDNPDKISSNIERQSMLETAGEAFISSPLIGQGSWFTAAKGLRAVEQRRKDIDPSFHGYSDEEARNLSIHSQLLVSLAEGGILGGAFFIFYGAFLAKTVRSLTRTSVPHRAFVFYIVFDGFWNLAMSPFSGGARLTIPLAICAGLLVILQRQGELTEDFRE
jgi:hypothetical protein